MRYTRTVTIFTFRKPAGDFHMIATCLDSNTKISAEVLLQFNIALYTSNYFCIYCHCITPFRTCQVLYSTLYIFLVVCTFAFALVIHIIYSWPSVICITVQFFAVIMILILFHLHILCLAFVSSHFKVFPHFELCTTQEVS